MGSRGFTSVRIGVVVFIRVRVRSPGRSSGHSGSREFTRGRRAVCGFIAVRVGSLSRTYGSSGSLGCLWVVDVIRVRLDSIGIS